MTATIDRSCDEALLALVTQGDPRAFEHFHDRHQPAAFRTAVVILRDSGLAADAVQDAFLACWRQHATYEPARGTARAWLLTITRNRSIDLLRRERTRRVVLAGAEPCWQVDDIQAPCDIESEVINRDELRHLTVLVGVHLARLPLEQRHALELAFVAGLTHLEIAETLGVPLGTVKGRIRLAFDKLAAIEVDLR